MTQAKTDLINKITSQFKAQITPGVLRKMRVTSGYFNTGLPLQYKHKVIDKGDLGHLVRIFDSVKVDRSTTEQLYYAVMQAKDPVQEILVPLLGSISEQIFEANLPELDPSIRQDFKQYAAIRQKYSDEDFKKIILRAILSGC